MPIYEYRCRSCGEVLEVLHRSMHTVESVECAKCGSDDLTRLISAANVVMGKSASDMLACRSGEGECDARSCADANISCPNLAKR